MSSALGFNFDIGGLADVRVSILAEAETVEPM